MYLLLLNVADILVQTFDLYFLVGKRPILNFWKKNDGSRLFTSYYIKKCGSPQDLRYDPIYFSTPLFLIMIGDLDKSMLTAFLSSFAYDTRVGYWAKTMEDLQNFKD